MTSPTVSDFQARANIARATRQSHSRLGRSLAHFRYSLLYAFDFKKQPFRLFFLVNYQLRRAIARAQPVYRWEVNHDVTDLRELEKTKRKDHTPCGLFFLAPRTGLEPVTS